MNLGRIAFAVMLVSVTACTSVFAGQTEVASTPFFVTSTRGPTKTSTATPSVAPTTSPTPIQTLTPPKTTWLLFPVNFDVWELAIPEDHPICSLQSDDWCLNLYLKADHECYLRVFESDFIEEPGTTVSDQLNILRLGKFDWTQHRIFWDGKLVYEGYLIVGQPGIYYEELPNLMMHGFNNQCRSNVLEFLGGLESAPWE